MPKASITKSFVESTTQPDWYWDTKLAGFVLRIQSGGKKMYAVCRKVRGTQRNTTVTIGEHGTVTTEQARKKAIEILAEMSNGINPNEQRKAQVEKETTARKEKRSEELANSITLKVALEDYLRVRDLKESTQYIYRICIEHYLADWLELPLTEITSEMIEQRHLKLSEFKAQANNSMRVLRAVLTYASVAYKRADGKPLLAENPVKRLSQTRAWNRVPRRQTVIKSHKLSSWYSAVSSIPNPVVKDYLLLVLFTGLRKSEAASLSWKNVDMTGKTLTVLDTKNRQDHMLPMSDFLYELLVHRWDARKNEFVFPGESERSYLKDCDAHIKKVSEDSGAVFTLHDLRRTFLTVAEQLDIPYYALKRLANHKMTSDVTSGYIISDAERLRGPMQLITDELRQLCGIKKAVAKISKIGNSKKSNKQATP